MFDLTGKSALITGASGGIGSAIARACTDRGRKWYCMARGQKSWKA